MANGEAGAAEGMDVVPSSARLNLGYDEINKSRDYIATKAVMKRIVTTVGNKLLTAVSESAARLAIGINLGSPGLAEPNKVPVYNAASQLTTSIPTSAGHAASKQYVDQGANGPTDAAYSRTQTGSGWYAVWMNSSNQFFRNTSSRRYKRNIREWAGSALGVQPVIFDRIDGDPDEVGFVAEDVLRTLPDAVTYFDGKIDGIADRAILAAVVGDLRRLAARVDRLERKQLE